MHIAAAARAMHEISSPDVATCINRGYVSRVAGYNLGTENGVSPSELPNEGTTLKLDINRGLRSGYSISGQRCRSRKLSAAV